MSNVSTFGTYTMARLGIYAAQCAINITGNNIANVSTLGYTRQAVDQVSLNMGGADRYQSKWSTRIGSGAYVMGVTQLRDPYLDIRYRNEQTQIGSYEGWLDGLNQIAGVLDEVGRGEDEAGVLEARFNELIQQMQNLLTQGAGKDEFDTLVRSASTSIVNTLHSYASQLQTQLDNQDTYFRQEIDEVNSILEKIRDLNASIRKTEVYGGNALELKDSRNVLIDELSKYIGINVTYEQDKLGEGLYVDRLVIKTDTNPPYELVNGTYCGELSITQVPVPVFDEDGNPVEDDEGNQVFEYVDDPLYRLTLSALKDEYGRSKKDSVSHDIGDNELTGKLQAEREVLTEVGEYANYTSDLDGNSYLSLDKYAATKRGIPYYMKALDTLANSFANALNWANMTAGAAIEGYTNPDGSPDLESFMANADEETLNKYILFSNDGTGNDTTNINASNISISQTWAIHEAKIRETRQYWGPNEEDIPTTANDNLQFFLALLTNDLQFGTGMYEDFTQFGGLKDLTEIPGDHELTFTGTFQEFLTTHMAGTLANDMSTTMTMMNNHEDLGVDLFVERDSIMGVDLNDEAMDLMAFQKAYQAACRLMTTYDSMLDKLINGT